MATKYGTYNMDTFMGRDDGVRDFLWGSESNDEIYGFGGDDQIFAAGGNDTIYGGKGRDLIHGGYGTDYMTGGEGRDIFQFARHDSGPTYSKADVIYDFNVADEIRFVGGAPVSTPSNYVEKIMLDGAPSLATTFERAAAHARNYIDHDTKYAFFTDGRNGYLFADLNYDNIVDTGIELRGIKTLAGFEYNDITIL